jgi:hypothetical protein
MLPAHNHISNNGRSTAAMPHFGSRDTGVRRKKSSSTKPSSAYDTRMSPDQISSTCTSPMPSSASNRRAYSPVPLPPRA